MEIAIPAIALGALYIISNQEKCRTQENLSGYNLGNSQTYPEPTKGISAQRTAPGGVLRHVEFETNPGAAAGRWGEGHGATDAPANEKEGARPDEQCPTSSPQAIDMGK